MSNENMVAMDRIIQIIYDIAWTRNTIVIPQPDKEILKKYVEDYREKQKEGEV